MGTREEVIARVDGSDIAVEGAALPLRAGAGSPGSRRARSTASAGASEPSASPPGPAASTTPSRSRGPSSTTSTPGLRGPVRDRLGSVRSTGTDVVVTGRILAVARLGLIPDRARDGLEAPAEPYP